jgi:superfamily II DNA or RNA helicase
MEREYTTVRKSSKKSFPKEDIISLISSEESESDLSESGLSPIKEIIEISEEEQEEPIKEGKKEVDEKSKNKDFKICEKFLQRASVTKNLSKFINPFSNQAITKGGSQYKNYLKKCSKIIGETEMTSRMKEVEPFTDITGKRKIYSCKKIPKKAGFEPKKHHITVRDRFKNIIDSWVTEKDLRGLLLYHGLGVGKTCSYSLIIDEYLKKFPDNYVFIFTPGSLRTNFIEQYCGFCGKNGKKLEDKLIFFTLNDSGVLEKLPQNFNNSLIIIDEVHNLTHGVFNESQNPTNLFNKIINSKKIFVVAGSGTPIQTDIQELYYLTKLFYPDLYFNLDYFMNEFEEKEKGKDFSSSIVWDIKNKNELKKKLCSFVSYFFPSEDLSEYPKVKKQNIQVYINPDRKKIFQGLVERELSAFPPNEKIKFSNPEAYKKQKILYYIAQTRVKSSQLSNYSYPIRAKINNKEEDLEEEIEDLDEEIDVAHHFLPDKLIKDGGWIDETILDDLDKRGEKIATIINDIQENSGKHAIYTKFKNHSGSHLIGSILDLLDIPYRFFDGDMNDQQRLKVLSEFNDVNNNDGSKVKVLILTDAGAEGINLLSVRRFHILEQGVNLTKMNQVLGRANRFRSHSSLPQQDRILVIRNYFLMIFEDDNSDLNNSQRALNAANDQTYSTDLVNNQRALKKDISISIVRDLIKTCNT